MQRVRVAVDGKGFRLAPSGRRFVPWGFNYDHDASPEARLIEDYWLTQWSKVAGDFGQMKRLGADLVRVHLQLARFMKGPVQTNARALARLRALIHLAEQNHLYLEITGLCSYRQRDTPAWYAALDERGRWAVQARFWEAVAAVGSTSHAVFSYDLMNEPAVPAAPRASWFGPALGNRTYVEFLARNRRGRSRWEVARQWLTTMRAAVRKRDRAALITVGLFLVGDQAHDLPIGGTPAQVAGMVDYLSVHLYPEQGRLNAALSALDELSVGKPVVVEETGPIHCSVPTLREFIERSRSRASGWLGFYWGKTIEEYRASDSPRDALMLGWLELFRELGPAMRSSL